MLERAFRGAGLRISRNGNSLPGRPDFVHRRARLVVFADGCFWHGHDGCYKQPKNNAAYWRSKIELNRVRRERVLNQLSHGGWLVLQYWECDIKHDPAPMAMEVGAAIAQRDTSRSSASAAS